MACDYLSDTQKPGFQFDNTRQDSGMNQPSHLVSDPLPLMAVRIFCKALDIDRSTAWRMEQSGVLPRPFYIGRRAYYPLNEVRKFVDRAQKGELATPRIAPRVMSS